MFQQMSEEDFRKVRSAANYGGRYSRQSVRDICEELLLYRYLGTLQQLSYATDAVAERDEYADALDQIASAPHAPDAYLVARAAREKA